MMKEEDSRMDDGLQELLRRAEDSSTQSSAEVIDKIVSENNTHKIKPHIKSKLAKGNNKKSASLAKDDKARKAFRKLTGWDDNTSVNASLRAIIGGDILAGKWFQRHLLYLFVLVILAIFYVTNRYAHQNEIIDNRKLTLALEDRRLRAVVARSNLTEYMRRSNISKNLTDSTLKSSHTPFYYLQTH